MYYLTNATAFQVMPLRTKQIEDAKRSGKHRSEPSARPLNGFVRCTKQRSLEAPPQHTMGCGNVIGVGYQGKPACQCSVRWIKCAEGQSRTANSLQNYQNTRVPNTPLNALNHGYPYGELRVIPESLGAADAFPVPVGIIPARLGKLWAIPTGWMVLAFAFKLMVLAFALKAMTINIGWGFVISVSEKDGRPEDGKVGKSDMAGSDTTKISLMRKEAVTGIGRKRPERIGKCMVVTGLMVPAFASKLMVPAFALKVMGVHIGYLRMDGRLYWGCINELYDMGTGINGLEDQFPFWDTNAFSPKRKSFTFSNRVVQVQTKRLPTLAVNEPHALGDGGKAEGWIWQHGYYENLFAAEVQWHHAHADMEQWQEEIEILGQEFCHAAQGCDRMETVWAAFVNDHKNDPGKQAYAMRAANMN
ncbi:hypothetical protein DFH08DRAFT_817629 [Mycena albidolilacea]|uniref:Uncharacterized protein n=1 Tax=Mycena albidolilacea TaxID=1033008 RepID=A0AAD6ZJ65_9AGAR|nr:hypothetical protein DFH08DRAFT_817629 [Mycena albidolilacea]